MHYHLKSKPNNKRRNQFITIIIVFIVLSSLLFFFPNFLRNTSFNISRPFWLAEEAISSSFSKIKDYFVFKSALIKRNAFLEDEFQKLKLKEVDYNIVSVQNQDLKNLLGRTEASSSKVISRILSKPPRSAYDTFIIDLGSANGVVVGDRVYLSENVILGTVKSVGARSSLVELFSSGEISQEAVLSRTGESFELLGQGGANFKVEVPKDTDILWGDLFVYPSLTQSVIGSVYYIDQNSQSSFKTIYLRIPENAFSSKYVFVELGIK